MKIARTVFSIPLLISFAALAGVPPSGTEKTPARPQAQARTMGIVTASPPPQIQEWQRLSRLPIAPHAPLIRGLHRHCEATFGPDYAGSADYAASGIAEIAQVMQMWNGARFDAQRPFANEVAHLDRDGLRRLCREQMAWLRDADIQAPRDRTRFSDAYEMFEDMPLMRESETRGEMIERAGLIAFCSDQGFDDALEEEIDRWSAGKETVMAKIEDTPRFRELRDGVNGQDQFPKFACLQLGFELIMEDTGMPEGHVAEMAGTLAQYRRCSERIDGYEEKAEPLVEQWSEASDGMVARFERVLSIGQPQLGVAREPGPDEFAKYCDQLLVRLAEYAKPRNAAFADPEKTFAVFIEALVNADREKALSTLTPTSRLRAVIEKLPDESLQRMGRTTRLIRMTGEYGDFRTGIAVRDSGVAAEVQFRSTPRGWLIEQM